LPQRRGVPEKGRGDEVEDGVKVGIRDESLSLEPTAWTRGIRGNWGIGLRCSFRLAVNTAITSDFALRTIDLRLGEDNRPII
jgi:hypothetical protein